MEPNHWISEARGFVINNVEPGRPFTGNDLWRAGLPETKNRRNLSKVLLSMEAEGLIRRTGRRVRSVGGHGQPILEWALL